MIGKERVFSASGHLGTKPLEDGNISFESLLDPPAPLRFPDFDLGRADFTLLAAVMSVVRRMRCKEVFNSSFRVLRAALRSAMSNTWPHAAQSKALCGLV